MGTNTTTTTYHYDKLNRLIDIIPSVGKPVYYTYDLRGNRQTQQDKDYVSDFDDVSYTLNIKSQLIQVVDTRGNIANNYNYDAWGNIQSKTEGIANSFKYAGEILDEETELYYLRAC